MLWVRRGDSNEHPQHGDEATLTSTDYIDFYEELSKYLSIVIKYHQIPTLSILMVSSGLDDCHFRSSLDLCFSDLLIIT